MKGKEFDPRLMRVLAWSGPFLVGCWVLALVGGGFIPPKSPDASAQEIANWYVDNETQLRISTVVLMVTGSFWATWGAAIALLMRRTEPGWPVLTVVAVALVGGGYVFFEMVALFWGVAAFRPGDIGVETTLTLHDLGWFSVLFDWPPFALFNIVVAVAILRDKSPTPVFQRWVAYLCLWCALIFVPAGMIIFTKTSGFAYDGLFALYIPLGVFFLWMCAMTTGMLQAITRLDAEQETQTGVARDPEAALA